MLPTMRTCLLSHPHAQQDTLIIPTPYFTPTARTSHCHSPHFHTIITYTIQSTANEEAKAALLALAGAWLGRVSGGDAVVSSPEVAPKLETVAAVLAAGMRDMKSEAVRRAHLRAAVHAMGVSPDVRGPLAALAEPGWKLVRHMPLLCFV